MDHRRSLSALSVRVSENGHLDFRKRGNGLYSRVHRLVFALDHRSSFQTMTPRILTDGSSARCCCPKSGQLGRLLTVLADAPHATGAWRDNLVEKLDGQGDSLLTFAIAHGNLMKQRKLGIRRCAGFRVHEGRPLGRSQEPRRHRDLRLPRRSSHRGRAWAYLRPRNGGSGRRRNAQVLSSGPEVESRMVDELAMRPTTTPGSVHSTDQFCVR